jgi:hypothetical protein
MGEKINENTYDTAVNKHLHKLERRDVAFLAQ